MADLKEKATDGSDIVKESDGNGQHAEFYDPYKESRLTRMGLTFESFKRVPGTTAYVVILSLRVQLLPTSSNPLVPSLAQWTSCVWVSKCTRPRAGPCRFADAAAEDEASALDDDRCR